MYVGAFDTRKNQYATFQVKQVKSGKTYISIEIYVQIWLSYAFYGNSLEAFYYVLMYVHIPYLQCFVNNYEHACNGAQFKTLYDALIYTHVLNVGVCSPWQDISQHTLSRSLSLSRSRSRSRSLDIYFSNWSWRPGTWATNPKHSFTQHASADPTHIQVLHASDLDYKHAAHRWKILARRWNPVTTENQTHVAPTRYVRPSRLAST